MKGAICLITQKKSLLNDKQATGYRSHFHLKKWLQVSLNSML